jgi:hypothetical protein
VCFESIMWSFTLAGSEAACNSTEGLSVSHLQLQRLRFDTFMMTSLLGARSVSRQNDIKVKR